MEAEELQTRLKCGRQSCPCGRSRGNVHCPAHDDRTPSLSVSPGADGRVLIDCKAGCSPEAIIDELGLKWADLFPDKTETLATRIHREPSVIYDYRDESGGLLYQVLRYEPKAFRQRRPDGKGDWIWTLGDVPRVLYRLPDVLAAVESGETIYITEGEKDADAIAAAGGVATTSSGGARKWRTEYSECLRGAAHVVVVQDRDDAGRKHAAKVFESLSGKVDEIDLVEAAAGKDAFDHLSAGHGLDDFMSVDPTPIPDSRSLSVRESGMRLVRIWERSEPAPREYCVAGLIPLGATTVLYGDGGQGKSLIALAIAVSITAGLPLLDREVRQCPVLYVDAELDADEFTRRAFQVARGMGLDGPPEGLHYVRLAGSLTDRRVLGELRETVAESGAGFAVLDSLTIAAYGGDIERAQDVIAVMKHIEELLPTWLAVDHAPKPRAGVPASAARPFGSAFKFNIARSVIHVMGSDSGTVMLRPTKHNFGVKGSPIGLEMEFHDDAVSLREVGLDAVSFAGIAERVPAESRVYQALLDHGEEGATPADLASEAGIAEKTARNHLTRLNARGLVESLGDGRWSAFPNPDTHRDQESGIAG